MGRSLNKEVGFIKHLKDGERDGGSLGDEGLDHRVNAVEGIISSSIVEEVINASCCCDNRLTQNVNSIFPTTDAD